MPLQILGENTRIGKYNPDLAEQVTKQIEQEEQQAKLETKRKPQETEKEIEPVTIPLNQDAQVVEGFIYVPSTDLYVRKEIAFAGNNWYDCHRKLDEIRERMQTIPEFIEFIKYLRANPQGVKDARPDEIDLILYNILEPTIIERGEWLDAKFYTKDNKIEIGYNYEVLKNQMVKPRNLEPLEDCLINVVNANIDLDRFLNNHTNQGMPKFHLSPTKKLRYSAPSDQTDKDTAAAFYNTIFSANFCCDYNPNTELPGLGVRPALKIRPSIQIKK